MFESSEPCSKPIDDERCQRSEFFLFHHEVEEHIVMKSSILNDELHVLVMPLQLIADLNDVIAHALSRPGGDEYALDNFVHPLEPQCRSFRRFPKGIFVVGKPRQNISASLSQSIAGHGVDAIELYA
jgi:hypothetical protein